MLNFLPLLIIASGLIIILIGCMIFLSQFLDILTASMSAVYIFV